MVVVGEVTVLLGGGRRVVDAALKSSIWSGVVLGGAVILDCGDSRVIDTTIGSGISSGVVLVRARVSGSWFLVKK